MSEYETLRASPEYYEFLNELRLYIQDCFCMSVAEAFNTGVLFEEFLNEVTSEV